MEGTMDKKAEVEEQPEGEKMSKKALKKQQKALEKQAESKPANDVPEAPKIPIVDDPTQQIYGDYQLCRSQKISGRQWLALEDITEAQVGEQVLIRSRLQNCRLKGNLAFLLLRDQFNTMQAVGQKSESITKDILKFIDAVPRESIVDVGGFLVKPEVAITSSSVPLELKISSFYVVSRSEPVLPFQIDDASRQLTSQQEDQDLQPQEAQSANQEEKQSDADQKELASNDDKLPVVSMSVRLDNRIIDLRTSAKQAIFRIQSGVGQLFREFLYKEGFIEIHTPKLIPGTSEGGAQVFKLDYFGNPCCLAQSPQLYKQMCIMGDMKRVFEIGPVFRAENANTHRHLTEFVGLDLEMEIKEHYTELLTLLGNLFTYIFNGLETKFARELKEIQKQFPFPAFLTRDPVLMLTFEESVTLLKENGINQDPLEDFDTANERKLGEIVRQKYNTDFYIVYRYPASARPFYTMLCADDPNYTISYDIFIRGEEITSGAQRNHDSVSLSQRATELGIDVATIRDYIQSFCYGAFPHGGCGIGLERVVMLYCQLKNIRNASLFPRDPKRISP